MSFGKNIKKIRTIKKLSQSAFAELFDMTRSSIGAYEEGRAEPKLDMIIKIANYFSISVDSLVSSDITVNELAHFKKLDDYLLGNPEGENNSSRAIVSINTIPLVSVNLIMNKQWSELKDETLSQISLPNLGSDHVAFLFNADEFEYSPKPFENDDVVVVSEYKSNVIENKKYYLIKTNKQLMIGEVKPAGKSALLFIKPNQDIEEISKNKIQALYIIEKHIINRPVIVDDTTDKIKKLEHLVHDLYHRLE